VYKIESILVEREEVPKFVDDYLNRYGTTQDRLKHFTELMYEYFQRERRIGNGFLKWYFAFESDLKLVLAALRGKIWGIDWVQEFQFVEHPTPLFLSLSEQGGSGPLLLPDQYQPLQHLFDTYKEAPLELDDHIDKFRFDAVEEKVAFEPFSIEHILAYLVQFLIVWKEQKRDAQQGRELIETIVRQA
jgi:hypothetical protein